jgi:phosphoserine phosphatase RsbU/P
MRLASSILCPSPLETLREEELEEARAIQGAMLPTEPLHIGNITVAHRLHPVHEVGGDFLDYFALSDQTVGLYLGDVAGKGLPGALYAALVVGTLRGVHKTGQSPTAVLSLLNRRLCVRAIPSRYAAVAYAVLDPCTREMRICSAGMYGPLHLSRGGCCNLRLTGLPPGLFANAEYDSATLVLAPGDSVIFLTDGLAELGPDNQSIAGIDYLAEVCAGRAADSPGKLLDAIFGAVQQSMCDEKQHDDMAAVIFHLAE